MSCRFPRLRACGRTWPCLVLSLLMLGADAPPRGYVATRAARPITVDGKLDDPAWAEAAWTDDFVDIEGSKKPNPRFRTRVKMLWDDQFFYVAADMVEPHVWATITQHDAVIFHDNDFEVFIDPDGDHHEYFELEINAQDAEWDLFLPKPYRDGGSADNGWEIPGLKAKAHVDGTLNDPTDTDRGWSVELAIPWASMAEKARTATPPRDGDQWRVNFSRVEWEHTLDGKTYQKVPKRPEANWVWSPQGTINMHRPERWGYVQFSSAKPGAATFRPDPSGPARDLLMQVYEAQKTYHAQHKAWAPTLEALGRTDLKGTGGGERPSLRLDDQGYQAEVTITNPSGTPQVWRLRHDSRISWKSN